ncbi:hypothetical protein DAEQUDRAFT_724543 [Daedalea quercina L-15889]|uniref:Integral membrane protein n=1 Tax=Daedalea quercina L-15889 TaxID=1314783 RepID=A0A165RUD7_9APHY|nr:hypothetical protein DAEQUDRAFT_724543 [Daedalea quercina L-15889]
MVDEAPKHSTTLSHSLELPVNGPRMTQDTDGSTSHASTTYSTHPRTVHRPFAFFYPTHAVLTPHSPALRPTAGALHWSSRASRKNRIAPRRVHVTHNTSGSPSPDSTEKGMEKGTKDAVAVEQRLRHPQTRLKAHLSWDVSFWVALVFTVGSIFWVCFRAEFAAVPSTYRASAQVINGFLLYLPLAPSHSPSHGNAAQWIAFIGGTAFEVGSYLMVVEALNAGHEQLFGPALWGLVEDWEHASDEELSVKRKQADFRWFGTTSWRELGFLASVVQLFAATVFWVSTVTGLPGVIRNLSTNPPIAITDVFFWTPQVVGGTGFILSSLLLMIECQRKWWLPNLRSLGWHIGFWNLVGAVGFTLCGALGYASFVSSKVSGPANERRVELD